MLERSWSGSSIGVSTIRLGPLQNTCSGWIPARIFDRGVNNSTGTLPDHVFWRDLGQDLRWGCQQLGRDPSRTSILERSWSGSLIGVSTIRLGPFQNTYSGGIPARTFDRCVHSWAGTPPEPVFWMTPGRPARPAWWAGGGAGTGSPSPPYSDTARAPGG